MLCDRGSAITFACAAIAYTFPEARTGMPNGAFSLYALCFDEAVGSIAKGTRDEEAVSCGRIGTTR